MTFAEVVPPVKDGWYVEKIFIPDEGRLTRLSMFKPVRVFIAEAFLSQRLGIVGKMGLLLEDAVKLKDEAQETVIDGGVIVRRLCNVSGFSPF